MYVRSQACTMSLCMYVDYPDLQCHNFFACTDFLRMQTHMFLFGLRSYVCKILGLNHVLMQITLISIACDFYACTEFPRIQNSTIFLLVLNSYVRRSNILFQLRIKCVTTLGWLLCPRPSTEAIETQGPVALSIFIFFVALFDPPKRWVNILPHTFRPVASPLQLPPHHRHHHLVGC